MGAKSPQSLPKSTGPVQDVGEVLELLGLRVRDKVTGLVGVVSSVAFDLYGCTQAVVTPEVDKAGKLADSHWFDISRLVVLSVKPVMARPNFGYEIPNKGPAEKPTTRKP